MKIVIHIHVQSLANAFKLQIWQTFSKNSQWVQSIGYEPDADECLGSMTFVILARYDHEFYSETVAPLLFGNPLHIQIVCLLINMIVFGFSAPHDIYLYIKLYSSSIVTTHCSPHTLPCT